MSHTLISRSSVDARLRRRKRLTGELMTICIAFADVAAVIGVAMLTGIGYHWMFYGQSGDLLAFLRIGLIIASVVAITNLFRGEYQLANFLSVSPHLRRTVALWNMAFVSLLVLGFVGKVTEIYSRGWFVVFYFAGLAVLLVLRGLAVQLVRRSTGARLIATKRVFLIGNAGEIEHFLSGQSPVLGGLEIAGCRFLSEPALHGPAGERHATLHRELAAVLPGIRQIEPDAIFILAPWSDQTTIDACAEAFLSLPAEIHLGPGQALRKYGNARLTRLGPVVSLQLVRLPLSRFELLQKRVLDVTLASIGLVLLAPLLALLAVVIKLDSRGPVLFLQRRYGFNQKSFRIVKFRTMRTADDGPVVPQATHDDPRITRAGRWLRRWNLDELPQLFNVLRGEMSLVGPRPHALSHNRAFEHIIARYARRHNVKPGITGWAQVHGIRGETDTPEKMRLRVEYDLYYIESWSLSRDLLILLRTVMSPVAYRNAR